MNQTNTSKSKAALRREREKEQRCQAILSAAEQLFSGKGYHATAVEEIADLAEVSVGTVYFYFKNKEQLLICLIEEVGYSLRKLLGRAFTESGSTLEGISNAGITFFRDFCLNHPGKISILFREAVGQSREVEETRKLFLGRLTKDLQQALDRTSEQQDFRYQNPFSSEVMAVCILGVYDRIACNYLLWQNRSAELLEVAGDVVRFTLGGIRNMIGTYLEP